RFARSASWKKPQSCVMRSLLRGSKTSSRQSPPARMSGLARIGLQRPERGFASLIVTMTASLLMTMRVVTGGGAIADERAEALEKMVRQRRGMKTEEDYRRFARERGLPQLSDPPQKDMDRLRWESQKEFRLKKKSSRRNSSNLSAMSDQ